MVGYGYAPDHDARYGRCARAVCECGAQGGVQQHLVLEVEAEDDEQSDVEHVEKLLLTF